MQLVYLTNMYAYGGEDCANEIFHSWFRDGDPKYDNAKTSELGPAPGYVPGGANHAYCPAKDHKCHTSLAHAAAFAEGVPRLQHELGSREGIRCLLGDHRAGDLLPGRVREGAFEVRRRLTVLRQRDL